MNEDQRTFKWLMLQLKKSHSEIYKLKEKDEMARKNMSGLLDMYEPTMDNDKYMLKRSLALHKKLKTYASRILI